MFTACSDDDNDKNNNGEENQTNTSFVVTNTNGATLENVVIGYFAAGKCKKIIELGNLKKDEPSKEVTVDYDVVKEAYIFTDTPSPAVMWSIPIKLEKGKKVSFKIAKDGEYIFANPKDETKYPH